MPIDDSTRRLGAVQRSRAWDTTGKVEASALVFSGAGTMKAVLLYTDGTNDASLTIYDNTAASGKIIREVHAKGSDGKGPFGNENAFVYCSTGCYAALSGTGAYFIIDHGE